MNCYLAMSVWKAEFSVIRDVPIHINSGTSTLVQGSPDPTKTLYAGKCYDILQLI